MDKVLEEIKKTINDFGKEIIKERRLIFILSDYGVLKDYRAERRILMDVIDSGYAENILKLSTEIGDSSLKICSYISEMHNRYGYQIKKLMTVFQWLVDGLEMKTVPFDSILHIHSDEEDITEVIVNGNYSIKDPFSLLSNYKIPGLSLLTNKDNSTIDDITSIAAHVKTILEDYGIIIENLNTYQTPVLYFLTFSLSSNIRMTKLVYLQDKISEGLAPIGCRLLVPIPGTNRIGLEIPKKNVNSISFYPVLPKTDSYNRNNLYCSIGIEPEGSPFSFKLDNVGHVLISGMANSGKTNCIHSMILSLLSWCNPCILKFAIISSHNASYYSYEKIAKNFIVKSHGGYYIAKDINTISMLLLDIEQELLYREGLISKSVSANIKEYNAKYVTGDLNPDEGYVFLPYIILVIDELSELNDVKNANTVISMIAKNGHKNGIILVIATRNRIKRTLVSDETLKCICTRISLKHENSIMAKIFMNNSEASRLLPYGDFLYQDNSMLTTKRVSNALIDENIKNVLIQYLSTQPTNKKDYILKHNDNPTTIYNYDFLYTDKELFYRAAQLIVVNKKCTEALLQKELNCSFNHAHEIILQFDRIGLTQKKSGTRTILVDSLDELERFLSK